MRVIYIYTTACFLFSTSVLYSQAVPELTLKSGEDKNKMITGDTSSYDRYAAFYLGSGIYAYNDDDLIFGKVELTGDISFQLSRWFYLDFKGDVFRYKKKTYGIVLSVFSIWGYPVINERFMMMSGVGLSIIAAGKVDLAHGSGDGILGIAIVALSRLRYKVTNTFGLFTEIRYGVTPYSNNITHHLFFNAGISLQGSMITPNTPSY